MVSTFQQTEEISSNLLIALSQLDIVLDEPVDYYYNNQQPATSNQQPATSNQQPAIYQKSSVLPETKESVSPSAPAVNQPTIVLPPLKQSHPSASALKKWVN